MFVKKVHEIFKTKCFQPFLTYISHNNNWTVANGFLHQELLYSDNVHLGHNILRLFDILPNFPFTTSERILIISIKYGIHELPHELLNALRLRILGNWEISRRSLNFIEL